MSPIDAPTPAAAVASLEIRYTTDPGDATAGFWHGTLGHPFMRRKVIPVTMLAVVVATIGTGVQDGLLPALGYPAGTVGALLLLPVICRWQARRNPLYAGPHNVCISEEGFAGWSEGFGEVRLLWRQLDSARSTSSHLFFHWKTGGTTLIPRRAFAEPGADEQFLQTARQWHAAAVEAPP